MDAIASSIRGNYKSLQLLWTPLLTVLEVITRVYRSYGTKISFDYWQATNTVSSTRGNYTSNRSYRRSTKGRLGYIKIN